MVMLKKQWIRIIALGLFCGTGFLMSPFSWGEPNLQKAPSFELLNPEGETVHFEDFAGKVMYLDFWGTWCPPCIEETPHLNAVYQAYKEKGFVVVGIALGDSKYSVQRYVKKMNVLYPVVLGDDKVIRDYRGIIFLPTAFLIDREGYIRRKLFGYKEKEEIERLILPLLEEENAP